MQQQNSETGVKAQQPRDSAGRFVSKNDAETSKEAEVKQDDVGAQSESDVGTVSEVVEDRMGVSESAMEDDVSGSQTSRVVDDVDDKSATGGDEEGLSSAGKKRMYYLFVSGN